MDSHKRLHFNDALESILYSESDFGPDDSTKETVTAVRKRGTKGKNQDIPQQQEFKESDEDNISLSNMVKFKHKFSWIKD